MKRLGPFFLFLLLPVLSRAQTVENFKLPKNYLGRLDEILIEMGNDLSIHFIFDQEYLKNFNTSLMTDSEKSVGGVLRMFS